MKLSKYKRTDTITLHNKVRAQTKKAIREGILIRPEFCQRCRTSKVEEEHHRDYSNPLDAMWLCRKCHIEVGREEKMKRDIEIVRRKYGD